MQLAVEVDADLEARIVVHGLQGRGAAPGVADHADPVEVEGGGEAGRQLLVVAQPGEPVQDEAGVVDPGLQRLAQEGADVEAGLGHQGGEDGGGEVPVGEGDLGGVVGVVDGDDDVAARGEVLHQAGAPRGCPPRLMGLPSATTRDHPAPRLAEGTQHDGTRTACRARTGAKPDSETREVEITRAVLTALCPVRTISAAARPLRRDTSAPRIEASRPSPPACRAQNGTQRADRRPRHPSRTPHAP